MKKYVMPFLLLVSCSKEVVVPVKTQYRHLEVWTTYKPVSQDISTFCIRDTTKKSVDTFHWDYWGTDVPDTRGQLHSATKDSSDNGYYYFTYCDSLIKSWDIILKTSQ